MDCTALLSAWEEGVARSAPDRALLLLAATHPNYSLEAWSRLPIGQRDAWLLTLREQLFGSRLELVAGCPECGERLEMSMNVADLRVPTPTVEPSFELEQDGVRLKFRLPNSVDLALVAGGGGREVLLSRCVEASTLEGEALESGDLSPALIEALDAQMEAADPQAVVEIALDCPACSHAWTARFDIVAILWSEVENWATGLLRDVQSLASAYGWTERDVFALSPLRRRIYREMIGA